jgi:hypothetical protein
MADAVSKDKVIKSISFILNDVSHKCGVLTLSTIF